METLKFFDHIGQGQEHNTETHPGHPMAELSHMPCTPVCVLLQGPCLCSSVQERGHTGARQHTEQSPSLYVCLHPVAESEAFPPSI